MRNIYILASSAFLLLIWSFNFISDDIKPEENKPLESFSLSIDDTNFQQFEVKNLAKLLGVDYELIKSEHSADVSSSVDITLSLISIFTSGELAKVRLKYQEDNEISYVDLTEGEQFYSYQITQIHSSSVVLKNQEQTISLKMFKPHLVTITKQNNEEDVTQ